MCVLFYFEEGLGVGIESVYIIDSLLSVIGFGTEYRVSVIFVGFSS
jgi:hypothetical protein